MPRSWKPTRKRILFDTGARSETVLHNAQQLGVDFSSITAVVLSHWQDEDTGGLTTLRRELRKRTPAALSVALGAVGASSTRKKPTALGSLPAGGGASSDEGGATLAPNAAVGGEPVGPAPTGAFAASPRGKAERRRPSWSRWRTWVKHNPAGRAPP